MPWIRAFFLIATLLATSGYKFRCWIFCTDQTAIQNDYVEQRDRCREYAQLKMDLERPSEDELNHKNQLVTLFSECMGKNGWTVPDGKGEKIAGNGVTPVASAQPAPAATGAAVGAAAGAAAAAPSAAAAATTAAEDKASLTRSSECMFARQSASVSRIAAARAEACDLECKQRLEAAPEGPWPAACPSEYSPNLQHGVERP